MSKVHKSTRMQKCLVDKVQRMADVESRSFTNMLEVILNRYFSDSEVEKKGKAA